MGKKGCLRDPVVAAAAGVRAVADPAPTGKVFCVCRSSPVRWRSTPATSESEKISFNQLNRRTGHRIKYLKVDADNVDDEVRNEDIVKGYKVDTETRSSR